MSIEPPADSSRCRAVLLDAFGTLVELAPPAPALARELRERHGLTLSRAECERAFGAEIAYYRAHHLEGRDADSLAGLRRRCAAVLRDALPPAARSAVSVAAVESAMLAALRFRPSPEVTAALPRLRAGGLRLAVVSNWDVSLGDVLTVLGLSRWLDHVVTSAGAGAAKPDPAIFARALELLGLEPGEAIHVGDSPAHDARGARAAGIAPVLIDRGAAPSAGPVPVVASLEEVAALTGRV